jgi:hypothetical protein
MEMLHNLSMKLGTDYTRFAKELAGSLRVTSVVQLAALTDTALTAAEIPLGKAKQIIAAAKQAVAAMAPVSVAVASSVISTTVSETVSTRQSFQSPAVAALEASTAACKVVVCTAVRTSGSTHTGSRLELNAVLRKHGVKMFVSGSDAVFQHHTRDGVHHVEVGCSAQHDAAHLKDMGAQENSWVDLTDSRGFLVVDVFPEFLVLQFVATFEERPDTWLVRRRVSIPTTGTAPPADEEQEVADLQRRLAALRR